MQKANYKIIDTFDDFLSYWSCVNSADIKDQIESWRTSYMGKYPELLKMQLQSYKKDGFNWRDIARKHVFPKLPNYLSLMQEARKNILLVCDSVYKKICLNLKSNPKIVFVIYVGIGCGAGWATRYEKLPACLLGLENIADCRWHTKNKLQGLIAHEVGHLVHMTWRNKWNSFEQAEQDPLFLLYTEGVAARFEQFALGKTASFHNVQDKNWLSWCMRRKDWLAKEYLRRLEKDKPVNDFFGSWLDIKGKKYTGYFLGHECIYEMEKENSLKEIALFNTGEIKRQLIKYLRQ